jgi:hypothetical protein
VDLAATGLIVFPAQRFSVRRRTACKGARATVWPRLGASLRREQPEVATMLWTLIVVLFILWLLGFSLSVGGGLIHLLLVLIIIAFAYQLLTGRRAV